MKYLINGDYRIVMKGAAVSKSKLSDSEFVYDTDNDPLAVATMKEVAEANKFKVTGTRSSQVKKEFDEKLETLNIPEKREMSQTEKVAQIVKEGVEKKLNEDEILIQIVRSGVKFTLAAKMMKQAQIDLGILISAKDRYVKSKVFMEDEDFAPENYSDVTKMAKAIAEEVPNTSEKQAIAQIRKYCKELEIEIPKKPKATGAPFGIKVLAWMVGNPEGTVEEFVEYMEENERAEKFIESWKKKFATIQREVKLQAAEKSDGETENSEDEKETAKKAPAKKASARRNKK